ncbi:unnamed protein product [Closterium sp. NIES-64]|nr:unnamed protein product [Closterium sp. NIES-64]
MCSLALFYSNHGFFTREEQRTAAATREDGSNEREKRGEADTSGNESARRQGDGTSAEVCSVLWHLSEEDGRAWWDDARPAATGVWLPPTRPAGHPLKARRTLGARSEEGGAAAWRAVNTVTDIGDTAEARRGRGEEGKRGGGTGAAGSALLLGNAAEARRGRGEEGKRGGGTGAAASAFLLGNAAEARRGRGEEGKREGGTGAAASAFLLGDAAEARRGRGEEGKRRGGTGADASALHLKCSRGEEEQRDSSILLFTFLCGVEWCGVLSDSPHLNAGALPPAAKRGPTFRAVDSGAAPHSVWIVEQQHPTFVSIVMQ